MTTSSREVVTRSEADTEAAGERLAHQLREGDLLLLIGPLGAGKTALVRGLARGLGSSAHVSSATFQLLRSYPGRIPLAHVDLYRLERSAELADLGLDELLDRGAVAVEWGDRLALQGDQPGRFGRVLIQALGPELRRLRLEGEPSWSW
jgi:tRNA threonylcarbamoyladenosine biosynthesis protein TsaE